MCLTGSSLVVKNVIINWAVFCLHYIFTVCVIILRLFQICRAKLLYVIAFRNLSLRLQLQVKLKISQLFNFFIDVIAQNISSAACVALGMLVAFVVQTGHSQHYLDTLSLQVQYQICHKCLLCALCNVTLCVQCRHVI